jgi:serine protease Do
MMTFPKIGLCSLLVLILSAAVVAQDPSSDAGARKADQAKMPPDREGVDKEQQEFDPKADPKADQFQSEESDPKQSADDQPQEPNSDAPKNGEKGGEKEQSTTPKSDGNQSENQSEDEEKNESNRFARSFFGGLTQDSHRNQSKRSKDILSLVKPLVGSVEASTVKILSGSRLISLGTVVDRHGLILTKASELSGELNCKLSDGRKSKAVVVGVHSDTDLALLKIELDDLQAIHWGTDPIPVVGQWVVAPTVDEVHVGVVGVNARKIPPSSPFLGIGPPLGSTEEVAGAKIDSVQPNTPADEIDLMVGDIITKIDEVEIKNWDDLRKTLGQYDPKDEVTLTVLRGNKEMKIKAVLGDREKLQGSLFPQQDRSAMQNNMGSRPSQRRKDFPMAFQHDLGLNKTTCGGPVVNLNGQVVGINIARAGRVDSFALPVNTVLPVLELLKSGELAPAKVNQTRLADLEKELEEVNTKLKAIPETTSLENKLLVERARKEELDRAKVEMQKALEELENRIRVVEMKKGNFENELKSIKNERNSLDRKKFGLERERKSLSTGVR